jgi:hypothetical protein
MGIVLKRTTIMRRERYRSLSELVASFLRHWALSQMPQSLTGEWAALPPDERDAIDARLLELVRSGVGEKGSWLNARIYDAIKEIHGPAAVSRPAWRDALFEQTKSPPVET